MKKIFYLPCLLLLSIFFLDANAAAPGGGDAIIGPGNDYKGTCRAKIGELNTYDCVILSGTKNCNDSSDCVIV